MLIVSDMFNHKSFFEELLIVISVNVKKMANCQLSFLEKLANSFLWEVFITVAPEYTVKANQGKVQLTFLDMVKCCQGFTESASLY